MVAFTKTEKTVWAPKRLVDIDERVTDTEIQQLMAKVRSIADREKGLPADFFTKVAVT